jgi:hypothetical protein
MKLSMPQMAQLLMQVGDVIPFRRRPQRGEVPGIPEVGPMGAGRGSPMGPKVLMHPLAKDSAQTSFGGPTFDPARFRGLKRADPAVDKVDREAMIMQKMQEKGLTPDQIKYGIAVMKQKGEL